MSSRFSRKTVRSALSTLGLTTDSCSENKCSVARVTTTNRSSFEEGMLLSFD